MSKLITDINDHVLQSGLKQIAESTLPVHTKLGKDSPQFETYLFGVAHGTWACLTDTKSITTEQIYTSLRQYL
jgi:hypothetical protein